jgi:hypothetical protein
MNQTKGDLDKLATLEKNTKKIEQSFTRSTEEEKENHLSFSPGEDRELNAMEDRLIEIYEYLHYNKYELDNNMQRVDWLHMYSQAVLKHGFNFHTLDKTED